MTNPPNPPTDPAEPAPGATPPVDAEPSLDRLRRELLAAVRDKEEKPLERAVKFGTVVVSACAVLITMLQFSETVGHNDAVERARQVELFATVLPHLASSDPQRQELAILGLARLGDVELATVAFQVRPTCATYNALQRLKAFPSTPTVSRGLILTTLADTQYLALQPETGRCPPPVLGPGSMRMTPVLRGEVGPATAASAPGALVPEPRRPGADSIVYFPHPDAPSQETAPER